MSAAVELRRVTKRFGAVCAVDDVSLGVRAGEFLTLLGPSGCGKTTLLRLVAGFEAPDAGTVLFDGTDVTRVPAYRRDVNQVFQSYALFPHLSVRENIGFGLQMQRRPRGEIETRVAEAVALVSLTGCEDRKPHELSGGQRQRVALARALAPRPAVLLLDEPLSALDARLRQAMQLELKRLQRQVGTTFILVTHDQEEALTMSDRIALLHRGRVEQCSNPQDLYRRPATPFAAEFVGQANLTEAHLKHDEGGVKCVLQGGLELRLGHDQPRAEGSGVVVSIRPEKIHVSDEPLSGENVFGARVDEIVFKGAFDRLVVTTDAGTRLTTLCANPRSVRENTKSGDRIWCRVAPEDVVVVPHLVGA